MVKLKIIEPKKCPNLISSIDKLKELENKHQVTIHLGKLINKDHIDKGILFKSSIDVNIWNGFKKHIQDTYRLTEHNYSNLYYHGRYMRQLYNTGTEEFYFIEPKNVQFLIGDACDLLVSCSVPLEISPVLFPTVDRYQCECTKESFMYKLDAESHIELYTIDDTFYHVKFIGKGSTVINTLKLFLS